jgi:hypothetical protein
MGSGAHENERAARSRCVVHFVDQQEIPADVAFSRACPFAFQRVVAPFRRQRASLAISSSIASLSWRMS